MSELGEGSLAPQFDLPRDGGRNVSLAELAGNTVVLYFYPKDDTSGCTVEAIDFTGLADEFAKAGAVVIGVSPDPVKAHDKFIAKHDLGVILASDEDKSMLEAYGVWKEKTFMGKKYMGNERTTFVVGEDGRIVKIFPNVKPEEHAEAVVEVLR